MVLDSLAGELILLVEADRVAALSLKIAFEAAARTSAKPSGATLRCAPPALALRPHNLEVVNSS